MDENPPAPPDPPRRYFEDAESGPPDGEEPPRQYFDAVPDDQQPYMEARDPSKPSGGLMALGIIAIVVGSLGLLINCCGIGSMAMMPLFGRMPNMPAQQQAMYSDMGSDTFVMVNGVISSLLWIALFTVCLVGGIGILKLRAWGRRLCLGYSVATLVLWVIVTLVNWFVVQPRMAEIMQGMPGAEMQNSMLVKIGGVGLGFMCYDILPIVMLVALTRPKVKEQFLRAEQLRSG